MAILLAPVFSRWIQAPRAPELSAVAQEAIVVPQIACDSFFGGWQKKKNCNYCFELLIKALMVFLPEEVSLFLYLNLKVKYSLTFSVIDPSPTLVLFITVLC